MRKFLFAAAMTMAIATPAFARMKLAFASVRSVLA